jgi:alkylated DNA repair dioxygenase AlkB
VTPQFNFFAGAGDEQGREPYLPEGLTYRDGLITPAVEDGLLARVRELPFKEFEFHGFQGKRRTVSFGWQYEFSGRGALRKAEDIPDFLLGLRTSVASFASLDPAAFQHVLVIEYGPGAGIGWHRDKPVFGEVVGVSLLADCVLRFRRKLSSNIARTVSTGNNRSLEGSTGNNSERDIATSSDNRRLFESSVSKRQGPKQRRAWERKNLNAAPRSAYHLTGPARFEWEHSISRVDALRYSITFRTLNDLPNVT